MRGLGRISERLNAARRYFTDRHRVLSSVRHVSGPERLRLGSDEAVAICVGNNAEYYLPTFFDWHRRLGIEHFLYIDNCSTDASVDLAASESGATVVKCDERWKLFEKFIRSDITRRFVKSGWCAMIDSDELLQYDGHDTVTLPEFLKHENERGYTAVIAQMLDMFPEGDIRDASGLSYDECIRDFRYFDLRNITRLGYYDVFSGLLKDNRITNPDTCFLMGGIRMTMFGEDCYLTKHPLIRIEDSRRPFIQPHYSNGVTCSDRTVLLRHYKFSGDVIARDEFRRKNDMTGDWGHVVRMKAYDTGAPLAFHSEHAHEFAGTEDLKARGFLI